VDPPLHPNEYCPQGHARWVGTTLSYFYGMSIPRVFNLFKVFWVSCFRGTRIVSLLLILITEPIYVLYYCIATGRRDHPCFWPVFVSYGSESRIQLSVQRSFSWYEVWMYRQFLIFL
jgi:hypothetical protein